MNITLELWDDQSDANEADVESTSWVFKLNGEDFPDGAAIMCLQEAHRIACKLMDIECIAEGVKVPLPVYQPAPQTPTEE